MGEFDRILKENIEAIFLPLLEKLVNFTIAQSFEIKDKIQTTLEREPDFLKRVIDGDGKEFILQLEFQTTNDPEMVYRMAEYYAIILRKYRLPVRQYVIYLGDPTPTMRTMLYPEEQIRGFELYNIRAFSTDKILDSEIPEEIILAILADYKKADAQRVIEKIIEKLQKATKSENELRRVIEHLLIIARLRKLEIKVNKKVKSMPITYDKYTDGLYLEGIEDNKRQLVKNALIKKNLTIEQIAEVIQVDIEYVLAIQKELDIKD